METKYNIKFYRSIKKLNKFCVDKIYKPTIINKELIPEENVLFLGNHKSAKDIMLLCAALEDKDLRFMAKKEHFDKIYGPIFLKCGAFPINRNHNDIGAVKTAITILRNKEDLVIFPEGTRNKTDEPLLPFKKGFSKIALLGNAKIVPFGITGEYKFRSHPTLTFGETIDLKNLDIPKEEMDDYVENKILKLLKR